MTRKALTVLTVQPRDHIADNLTQHLENELGHTVRIVEDIEEIRKVVDKVDVVIVAPQFIEQLGRIKELIDDAPIVQAIDSAVYLNGFSSFIKHKIAYPYIAKEITQLCQEVADKVNRETLTAISGLLTEMVNDPNHARSLNRLVQEIVQRFPIYVVASIHLLKVGTLYCRVIARSDGGATANELFDTHLERGLLGKVCTSGEEASLQDLSESPTQLPPIFAEDGLRGVMAVPLRIRRDVIGVLSVFTRYPLNFSTDHIAKIRMMANVAALEAYNEQQSEARRLMDQVGSAWQEATDRASALSIIDNYACAIADSQGSAVCFYSADLQSYQHIRYKRESGLGVDVIDWEQSDEIWQLFHQSLFQLPELLVHDVVNWTDFAPLQEHFLKHNIYSFIAFPLIHDELPMGMLFVFYSWQHPYTISDQDNYEHHDRARLFQQQASQVVNRAYLQERHRRSIEAVQKWANDTHHGLPLEGANTQFWEKFIAETLLGNHIGAEHGAIIIFEGSSQGRYLVDMRQVYLEAQLGLHDSVENWVIRNKQPVLISNLVVDRQVENLWFYHDATTSSSGSWSLIASDKTYLPTSKLVVPIFFRDTLKGIIILESSQHTLNQYDAEHLVDLARSIGRTLHDDSPLSQLVRDAEQLPVLQPVRQWIESAANRLRLELAADLVSVLLYSPYWDSFQIPITSGGMQSAVLPYLRGRAYRLMKGSQPYIVLDEQTELQGIVTAEFWTREKLVTTRAICFYKDDLPIGLILIHWRSEYSLQPMQANFLRTVSGEITSKVIQNYTFSTAADTLQRRLNFDIVRLHLFKQNHQGRLSADLAGLRWAVHPISKGELNVKQNWTQRRKTGPVASAIRTYLQTGISFSFANEIAEDTVLSQGTFHLREDIKSGAYILLIINQGEPNEELLGTLFVNWRSEHQWTQAEKSALLSYARHMTLTIYNRRMVMTLKERGISENWIQELFGQLVRSRMSRERMLELVLETACWLTGAHFGDIRIREGETLVTEAVLGDPKICHLYRTKYRVLPVNGQGGLTYHAFLTGSGQIYTAANHWPEYINADGRTQSEMVIMIYQVETGACIGTINLEHEHPEGFNSDDRQHIISLAEVTAIILSNIDRYDYLENAQRELKLLEQLVLNGLVGANWLHQAGTKSAAINRLVKLIKRRLAKRTVDKKNIRIDLDEIARTAQGFIVDKGTLPKELGEPAIPYNLDDKLYHFVEYLRKEETFSPQFQLRAKQVKISMHMLAFRIVLEHLVKNSLRATERIGVAPVLSFETSIKGEHAIILYRDNGPGIPEHLLESYLKEPISPEKDMGSGYGMLVALFLLRRYKGDIRYIPQENSGALHEIRIPIINKPAA